MSDESNFEYSDQQWDESFRNATPLSRDHKDQLLNNINQRIDRKSKRFKATAYWCSGIAASVLLALLIMHNVQQDNTSRSKEWREITSAAHQLKVYLPDSSALVLSPNSSLSVSPDFKTNRALVLSRGSVFAAVTKDPAHPFSININDQKVTVLGTQFLISRKDTVDVNLMVHEGKVALDNSLNHYTVVAGQQIETSRSAGNVHMAPPQVDEFFTQTKIRFVNIEVQQLLGLITSYYQIKPNKIKGSGEFKVTMTWNHLVPLKENLAVLETLIGQPVL